MVKELSGRELAGFVKERQAHLVRSLKGQKIFPKLVIFRDSDNPVITKYVALKQAYGADIGVAVEDRVLQTADLPAAIATANADPAVSAIIVQLPLTNPASTDSTVSNIAPEKDVDGLSNKGNLTPPPPPPSTGFLPATTSTSLILRSPSSVAADSLALRLKPCSKTPGLTSRFSATVTT